MSPRSKKEYLETIFLRYKKASPKEKTLILNEFCATCGFHRKHAIRVLRRFKRFTQPQPNKRGRAPLYKPNLLLKPLSRIWRTANLPCSKRLKALLPLWLPGYVESFGPLPPQTLKPSEPYTASRQQPSIDSSIPSVSSTKKEAGPPPSQEPFSENTSPSKPTNGTNPTPAFSKPIPSPIAENPSRAPSPIPLTASISPPAGPNNEPSGEKEKVTSYNKSKILKPPCLSPCWASIVTTDPSSSITTSSDILLKENNPSSSPEAVPITKMITLT